MALSIITLNIITQHKDMQKNDTKHTSTLMTVSINKFSTTVVNGSLSIKILRIKALSTEFCYAGCQLCWVSSLLSVTNKSFMLSVAMLNVICSIMKLSRGHYVGCGFADCVAECRCDEWRGAGSNGDTVAAEKISTKTQQLTTELEVNG